MPAIRFRFLVLSVLIGLAAVGLHAALMLHTETTIAVPEANQEIPLGHLVYKARFEAKVSSVQLAPKTEGGVDVMVADWVFTGSNSDGQVHRVEMQIRLLDEAGKQISWFAGKHPLAPGARDQKLLVPMKVKAEVWQAAKRIRIFADWIT